MNNSTDLRSPISKAKGSGSSHSGTTIWWMQRLSAIALVPLVIWFIYFMLQVTKLDSNEDIMILFVSPFTTVLLAVFLSFGIYHGNIGMKEIVEDYCHCNKMKYFLLILLNVISLVTIFASLCSIIVYHLSTFGYN